MNYFILKYSLIPTYMEERGKYREEHLKLAKNYADRGLLVIELLQVQRNPHPIGGG